MPKIDYTSIRVTKEVRESLQNYVEECYNDLSINSMLKVHMENLNEGHVRFPKYGMYECPESRKQKMRSSISKKSIKKSANNLSLTGSLPSDPYTRTESDTMGEMGSLIEVADLVYVAGSMVPVGGHSPSEASQFGKPVIMGPHSEKCDAQIKDLVWSGGAIQIDKGPKMNENFLNNVVELLSNSERLEDMGRNSLIASICPTTCR